MNNKLYNYLRIKFAAADPSAGPWYARAGKAIASPFVDVGKSLVSGLGEGVKNFSVTSDAAEASTKQINNRMYNEALAALQRGEDPGYNPYEASYVSSIGGQTYNLSDDYDEAFEGQDQQQQQQQQYQQQPQPQINVVLPDGYGGGGGRGGGEEAPPSRTGLADYINNYSSRAGYR